MGSLPLDWAHLRFTTLVEFQSTNEMGEIGAGENFVLDTLLKTALHKFTPKYSAWPGIMQLVWWDDGKW